MAVRATPRKIPHLRQIRKQLARRPKRSEQFALPEGSLVGFWRVGCVINPGPPFTPHTHVPMSTVHSSDTEVGLGALADFWEIGKQAGVARGVGGGKKKSGSLGCETQGTTHTDT